MDRRTFLQAAAAGALGAGLVPWATAQNQTSGARPNVVVILADDMGYGDLACQNPASKAPTPHLDRLAAQGARFTDAHSPSAVCTPTRYGLLTGDYCWRTDLAAHVLWAWDEPLIAKDKLTMGGMLREQGYDTACIGKWHLGWDWPTTDGSRVNDEIAIGDHDHSVRTPFGKKVDFRQSIGDGPITRGFDYYFGDDLPNFAPYVYIENDRTMGRPESWKPEEMFGTPGPMVEGWDLTQVMPRITEQAVRYIRNEPRGALFDRDPDKPFFLYFPLSAPHTPIAPAEAFQGATDGGPYTDFVHQVDWTVGQIMQALEQTGQAENTLIIFSSDNGSPARNGENMAGRPRSVTADYGHNPSYPWRGIKTDAYEGGHRVPFIARWPGQIPAGLVSDQLLCLTDIMATCAAVTGYALPEDTAVDSMNMLPALTGAQDAQLRDSIVHHSYQGEFAIRRGDWKLILHPGGGGWDPPIEGAPLVQLFHIASDPHEQHNLHAHRPDIVEELQALLQRFQEEGRSVPA